jgi:hypothetical protein
MSRQDGTGGCTPFNFLDVTAVVTGDQRDVVDLVCQSNEFRFLLLIKREDD